MLPRLNELNFRLGNMRRFQQLCGQALAWSGVALWLVKCWA